MRFGALTIIRCLHNNWKGCYFVTYSRRKGLNTGWLKRKGLKQDFGTDAEMRKSLLSKLTRDWLKNKSKSKIVWLKSKSKIVWLKSRSKS